MASVNTLCKSVLNVKNTVIENCNLYSDENGVNIFASKQDQINGMRMTVLSAISHALFMINIPADQPSGEVLTGEVLWLKLSTRLTVSSALNMGYMLPKFHGLIQVADSPRILTSLLHGLHLIFLEAPPHIS